METIMFFATLLCAVLLGLSYGILLIRDNLRKQFFNDFNKIEKLSFKIPAPALKIFITFLIITAAILCWIEADYINNSGWIGWNMAVFAVNGCAVSIIALLVYCVLHPHLLKKTSVINFNGKYPLAHNISAIILFACFSVGEIWVLSIYGGAPNVAIFIPAALASILCFFIGYAFIITGRCFWTICKATYHGIKWLNRTYWDWVLKQ